MKIERIVIATRNPAKVNYYQHLFTGIVNEVVGLKDIGINGKPVETGETAEENAEIKARFYSSRTNYLYFAKVKPYRLTFYLIMNNPELMSVV